MMFPINIDLPNQVTCKIETTDVALKGQTVSSSYKPATLNNGLIFKFLLLLNLEMILLLILEILEYVKKI